MRLRHGQSPFTMSEYSTICTYVVVRVCAIIPPPPPRRPCFHAPMIMVTQIEVVSSTQSITLRRRRRGRARKDSDLFTYRTQASCVTFMLRASARNFPLLVLLLLRPLCCCCCLRRLRSPLPGRPRPFLPASRSIVKKKSRRCSERPKRCSISMLSFVA